MSTTLDLPHDVTDFLDQMVADERFDSRDSAITELVRLFRDQEDSSTSEPLAQSERAKIARGIEQADRGELVDWDEVERRVDVARRDRREHDV